LRDEPNTEDSPEESKTTKEVDLQAKQDERNHTVSLLTLCLSNFFYIYLVQMKGLNITDSYESNQSRVFVELSLCQKYKDPENAIINMIYSQWILINIGCSLHEVYRHMTVVIPASKTNFLQQILPIVSALGTAIFMAFILETSDEFLLNEYIKLLVCLFQIKMAFGLTAVVRALLKRSITTLMMQGGFFTYMLSHNFYMNW